MKNALRFLAFGQLSAVLLFLVGCAGQPQGIQSVQTAASTASIQSEPPGDYYIGRRYWKAQFKFWGYVRRPGQPWSTSQLVMFNEKQKLAPDREVRQFGSDQNFEYKLYGEFTGQKVYEPASNGFYPEFVLKSYEVISKNPAPIFRSQVNGRAQAALRPLAIERPE